MVKGESIAKRQRETEPGERHYTKETARKSLCNWQEGRREGEETGSERRRDIES
jgi:hypothetical protein